MIDSTLQQVSRARSNTARLLALFLTLSLMAHGLFFPQEWFIFGFALSGYVVLSYPHRRFNFVTRDVTPLGLTDVLLLGMIFFSVLGVVHPVKIKDGCIEALRWGTYWFIYRLGVRISSDETAKKHLVQYIEWLAIVVAFIGWLPWVSKVAGRLSSVFGYSNALAVFLGAVLLLYPRWKPVQIFLGISLLGTGSRAGVGLFLAVLIGQQLLLWVRSHRFSPFLALRQIFYARRIKKTRLALSLSEGGRYVHYNFAGQGWPSVPIAKDGGKGPIRYLYFLIGKITGKPLIGSWVILLVITGIVLMLLNNKQAWENITTWGFSSSSWQERLVYYKDGISLAWNAGGVPQAGGWMAFPTVQRFPYWTADPHSSFIHILLNQGVFGIISVGIWSVFTLTQAWKTSIKKCVSPKSPKGVEVTKAEVRVWGALLFLILHSLVDADFSFGALGFLFWMLFGSMQKRDEHPSPHVSKRSKLAVNLSSKGMFVVCLIVCLFSGSALLNPSLLEKEKIWNTQASLGREQDPAQSIALWNMSLNWDQTQISARREQAELLLRRGNTDVGLKAVEEVLHWQPLDLEAYEWAQSVVWDAADMQRLTHPETANRLYRWVEGVPSNIEWRVTILSLHDQLLWQGYRDFQPSQHIKLLAEFARQRQLTQLPTRT